jgi:hypothetical protein
VGEGRVCRGYGPPFHLWRVGARPARPPCVPARALAAWVVGQRRVAWLLASYGNPLVRVKVVAELEDPVHAMDVLGAIIATFGETGAPATFRSMTITAIRHDKPITVADLKRD